MQLSEADWADWVAQTELEGEVLLAFVTDTAQWVAELRDPAAPAIRRVLDIGSGPGVGTCELARLFPEAEVIAVDSSPAMLERAIQRATDLGLAERVRTHQAELPAGLGGLGPADVIWASMSLHHVGDEIEALRALRTVLAPHGVAAIAEMAEPIRMLPDDLDVGRPGLADRLEQAASQWFARMREGLPGSVPSAELASMLVGAGYEVLGARIARLRFDPPMAADPRRLAVGNLQRARRQLDEILDDDDRHALEILADPDDPRGVAQRPDVFLAAARQIVIAR